MGIGFLGLVPAVEQVLSYHSESKIMAYGLMTDFLYEVGDGAGEFLTEEEKANFIPLSLEDI
ncbi:hypothetical protein [Pseudomonas alabamensis]|uniref:hypothetical protein n=1 Tax=Pseudomonas alabamensis TaxID=3064349 RepID=UPI003F564F21